MEVTLWVEALAFNPNNLLMQYKLALVTVLKTPQMVGSENRKYLRCLGKTHVCQNVDYTTQGIHHFIESSGGLGVWPLTGCLLRNKRQMATLYTTALCQFECSLGIHMLNFDPH